LCLELARLVLIFGSLGWIFDSFGGYSWLFFASLGLALGAMAIAFAFPRALQPQLQPA